MKKIEYPLCNRKPERAPHILGHTFLLCWRCTMVTAAVVITAIILELSCVTLILEYIYVSIILMIPMIVDGVLQYVYKVESNNVRRAITGIFFGIGISLMAYILF